MVFANEQFKGFVPRVKDIPAHHLHFTSCFGLDGGNSWRKANQNMLTLSLAKQGEVLNKRDKPSKSVVWSGRNDAFQDYVDILLYFRRQDMQQDRTLVTQRKERNKQNDHRMIGSELPKQLPSGIKVRCPFSSVT